MGDYDTGQPGTDARLASGNGTGAGAGRTAATGRTLVLSPLLLTVRETSSRLRQPEARLAEAIGLTEAIDLDTVGSEIVAVNQPREPPARAALMARSTAGWTSARPDGVAAISVRTGMGIDDLQALLDRKLTGQRRIVDLDVDLRNGAALAWLYERGKVLERHDDNGIARFHLEIDLSDRARFERQYSNHS